MINPEQLTSPTAQKAYAEGRGRQLQAGVVGVASLAVVYGIVELVRHGTGLKLWPSTYLPLLGGIASIAALPVHMNAVKAPDGRSWGLAAGSLAVFVPYLLSLYLMGFLGIWSIYHAVTSHPLAWEHALAGAFWLIMGWVMLSELHRYQTHLISARNAGSLQ